MTMLRRAVFPAVLLALLLLPAAVPADALSDILERGKIRVGVSLFTPWAMKDKSGELTGFEVEVARKLAAEMGVQADFKVLPWSEIIGALQQGDIDVIISGMAITPRRALQLNFSLPYAESGAAIATNTAKTHDVRDLEDLNDPKFVVVAVAKTLGSDVAKLLFDRADLRIVANNAEAEALVLEGKAHAYIASTIETAFLALDHPEEIDLPLHKPLLASVAGMGVRKGEQELLNFLNAWVTARTADKWLSTTHKYWFKTLKWRDRPQ
ncbi:MAG: transporter substrate-binding domain-containing protein [Gammaproteobacteria bacterium]|nr:transporter substrate-binding domain-containing protein [Gammaproteobacteria bacterium]